jgi:hypothetical protein
LDEGNEVEEAKGPFELDVAELIETDAEDTETDMVVIPEIEDVDVEFVGDESKLGSHGGGDC